MYKITLICTKHKEGGKCNSQELCKIIESKSPEIIFEELSYNNFRKCYFENSLETLETDAIKMYLQNYDVEHIPVDTFNIPEGYDRDIDYVYHTIFDNKRESYDLRLLLENQISLERESGFNFLNHIQNDQLFERINNHKERILATLNNEKLFRIADLEKEIIEKRETEILDNIYNYCENHLFNQAILFIGSGHRSAIIKKINERIVNQKVKINWVIYNN
tara:strand:- start:32295 stop:32954 length:660 start_codon:yes stop_codon:yes gene_type:complete